MKLYLGLAAALALMTLGIGLFEYERPPDRCSQRLYPEILQDWCIDRWADVERGQAVLRAMREKNARETTCDHRRWFGLVGKNECPWSNPQ